MRPAATAGHEHLPRPEWSASLKHVLGPPLVQSACALLAPPFMMRASPARRDEPLLTCKEPRSAWQWPSTERATVAAADCANL